MCRSSNCAKFTPERIRTPESARRFGRPWDRKKSEKNALFELVF
jgi:hypothetical protein